VTLLDRQAIPPSRLCLVYSWTEVGRVVVDADKLRFPTVPDAAGIYRFELGDRWYIGEADRLRRRFQHYRTPGPSQSTNLRLNALMRQLLADGPGIVVSTITSVNVEIDGRALPLDLAYKDARLLVESAALVAARAGGRLVENL
jgi:hypothetical protein